MKKIVIFGIGYLRKLVNFYLTKDSPYEIVAFTYNHEYITDKTFI